MYIALTSDTLSDGELYKYATSQVQQRVNILPGVSQVQIFGVKSAIRIKVDPSALASRNITLDELSAADPGRHLLLRRRVSLTAKTLRWFCARMARLPTPRATRT